MPREMPTNSVIRGYCQLMHLEFDICQAIFDYEPMLDPFVSLKNEIVILHRMIVAILMSVDAPVDQFLSLGLRTSEESWREPPPDSQAAMEEVRIVVQDMEALINDGNIYLPLVDFYPLFAVEVANAMDTIQAHYDSHSLNGETIVAQQDSDAVLPATEEQINAMPEHIATDEDADQMCSICVSTFIAEEQIKILQCSHRYHKECIDTWLRQRATCPMDRSRVFPN